ncbi:MAG: hypothetical protein COA57_11040 [Flavobacteriales bacterium]|nr:MAG: hypothetical protein COA57_11040 [Flavobacteriales bacterium]
MNKKENNDNTKKLIQKLGTEKPALDFTQKVMGSIEAADAQEALKNKALLSLLQRTSIEEVPSGFTYRIMAQVEAQASAASLVYQPVISKRGWYTIITGMIALTTIALLPGTSSQGSSVSVDLVQYTDRVTALLGGLLEGFTLSPMLVLTIVALGMLLLLENFLKGVRQLSA